MISEAINKIIDLAEPVELWVGERPYHSKKIYPAKEPLPDALTVSTLTGLKDYIDENPDGLDGDELVFRIDSPERVDICGPLFGQFEQRKIYIRAELIGEKFPYERFMDPETFIIKLQAQYQQDDTTAKILSIVGNIKDERVATVADDGITQQVTAKVGIARVQNVDLPNPVTLTPYRTFLEAAQPSSQFVFRMRSGAAEKAATCALFEADGGRWKLEAIQNIKTWLLENVVKGIRVLA